MRWLWGCKFTSCSPCGTSVEGDWKLTRFDDNNTMIVSNESVTFTQDGWDFHGLSERYHIRGRVKGSWINLTMTVNGEEGEGWVALAEGSIYPVGSHLSAHLVIVSDTFGKHGSISLWRD